MSMRAVERFIKEIMDGDSDKALKILENAVGSKGNENKKRGRKKNDPVDEEFWYLLIWSELEGKKRNNENTSLEDELETIMPMVKRVNELHDKGVMPSRAKYYLWYNREKECLEYGDPLISKNLDFICEYLANLGFTGMY